MPNINQVRRVLLKAPPVAAVGAFDLTYQDAKTSAAGATPLTYSGYTLASGATRTIAVLLFQGGVTPGIASMTINGVACTQIAGALANAGGDQSADMWISNSAVTGGTIDVVVTYNSATSYHSAVALYNVTTATPAFNAADSSINTSSSPSITVGPINIPTGGQAVFGAYEYFGATATITSGNATYDATPASGGITFYFGRTTTTGASVSVTLTYSANDLGPATFVSWGP